MALTGLQIQKLLPKTNCKECGSNTCLAFAMKLAAKKAELSECPYASDEAKAVLGAASEPPVKTVSVGPAKVGGETVLYRHEKTFVNQPVLAVNVDDADESAEKTIDAIKDYALERVGEVLKIGAVAVTQTLGDAAKFLSLVECAAKKDLPVILRCHAETAVKAAPLLKGTGGVIAGATRETAPELAKAAQENGLVLGVTGDSLDELGELTAKIKESGFNDMLVDFAPQSVSQAFALSTVARRAAFANHKPMGYAPIRFIPNGGMYEIINAATGEICKYGGVIVFPRFDAALIQTAMILRQNIYTDPQKPIQVEPGVYPIGEPCADSYVFVTTNFSLTYFLVSGEIENCGLSAWLCIPECEGLSVLTAWAAGKFSGDMIGKFVLSQGLGESQRNKTVIIPGYVAQIKGDVQEALPGWNVLISSQEASDIESFVNANLRQG